MAGDKRFKKELQTVFSGEVINTNIAVPSTPINAIDYGGIILLVSLQSFGAPTSLRLQAQISPNSGGDWYSMRSGAAANLIWTGPSCAVQRLDSYDIGVAGGYMRILATGVGCSVANYFTLTTHILGYTV